MSTLFYPSLFRITFFLSRILCIYIVCLWGYSFRLLVVVDLSTHIYLWKNLAFLHLEVFVIDKHFCHFDLSILMSFAIKKILIDFFFILNRDLQTVKLEEMFQFLEGFIRFFLNSEWIFFLTWGTSNYKYWLTNIFLTKLS